MERVRYGLSPTPRLLPDLGVFMRVVMAHVTAPNPRRNAGATAACRFRPLRFLLLSLSSVIGPVHAVGSRRFMHTPGVDHRSDVYAQRRVNREREGVLGMGGFDSEWGQRTWMATAARDRLRDIVGFCHDGNCCGVSLLQTWLWRSTGPYCQFLPWQWIR